MGEVGEERPPVHQAGGGGTESVQGAVYHQTRSMMNYPDNILYVSINSKIFT